MVLIRVSHIPHALWHQINGILPRKVGITVYEPFQQRFSSQGRTGQYYQTFSVSGIEL
jgi:hypothetical protein